MAMVIKQVSPVRLKQVDTTILINLMNDTSTPILITLAERYHLRRVPGISKDGLIRRILRQLPRGDLLQLENDLIVARFGMLSVSDLLKKALQLDSQGAGKAGNPRMDQVSAESAIFVDGDSGRWAYTVHGYDLAIDLGSCRLSCSCVYFAYAARRSALCKHLALAFTLIPQSYAREALIDMIISREYGGSTPKRWFFESISAH